MSVDAPSHLSLVFHAGETRYALPVSELIEVVSGVEPLSSRRAKDLPVEDLAELLGERSSVEAGGVVLVLRGDPPRVVKVSRVEEVADTARVPFHQLPSGSRLTVPGLIRGALVHRERLALELVVSALPRQGKAPAEPCPGRVRAGGPVGPSGRVLVFEAGGRRMAAPLGQVGVVLAAPQICRVPLAPLGHCGVLLHGRAVHAVYDLRLLLGLASAGRSDFVVLLDAGGHSVGIVAERVHGADESRAGANELAPGGALIETRAHGQVLLPALDQLFGEGEGVVGSAS